MAFNDFMNKVRYWDNMTAKWLMRHFYFMFFQVVLVVVFVFWFINTLNIFDLSLQSSESILTDKILVSQNINTIMIVFLLLMNSFWMLYMFNIIRRSNNQLKDISYHISKLRFKDK